jgi:hypothetical protein
VEGSHIDTVRVFDGAFAMYLCCTRMADWNGTHAFAGSMLVQFLLPVFQE